MVLEIFRFVAIVYGPIIMLMGLLLFTPPGAHNGRAADFRRRVLLRDRQFWAMVIAMFCGTLPGLVVNGNLRPIGQLFGFSEMVALQAITMFAIGSASGRVLGGFAHDLFGGRRSLMLALGLITVSIVVLITAGLLRSRLALAGSRPASSASATAVASASTPARSSISTATACWVRSTPWSCSVTEQRVFRVRRWQAGPGISLAVLCRG